MKNIKFYRVAAGLSQKQLADRIGVSQQAVARWEAGGMMPRAEKLTALADTLHCTVDALLDGNQRKRG